MPPLSALRSILLAFAITRVALVLVGVAAVERLPIDPAESAANYHGYPPAAAPLEMWIRYDAGWYLAIAQHGYGGALASRYDMRPNFFPLYPALVAMVQPAVRSPAVAALIVSNIALLIFLCALWRWTEARLDAGSATRAVWLYLAFPTGFYLSGIYAESTMLAAIGVALVAAMRRRWLSAGCAGALALLARPLGALVVPALVIEWALTARRGPFRAAALQFAAIVGPAALAGVATLAIARHAFGDPFTMLTSQALYRGDASWPWRGFVQMWSRGPALISYDNGVLDAVPALLALLSLPWVFRRLGPAAGVYASLAVVVPLLSGLVAYSRLVLAAVPCFVVAASALESKRRLWIVLAALGLLQAGPLARFATWRWVA